jgi:hypothetical protein
MAQILARMHRSTPRPATGYATITSRHVKPMPTSEWQNRQLHAIQTAFDFVPSLAHPLTIDQPQDEKIRKGIAAVRQS